MSSIIGFLQTWLLGSQHLEGEKHGFDREKWDALRDGLSYEESALPVPEQGDSFAGPFALALLLEVLRYAGIILLVVALVIGVLRLLKVVKFKKDKKDVEALTIDTDMPAADAPMEELKAALEKAEKEENYKEAIRLWFQIALKHLDALRMVITTPEKTNWEYVGEIENKAMAQDFALLTRVFEWVWFGESEQTALTYKQYSTAFQSFIEIIGHEK